MKKLVLTLALGMACASALAQGTLNFANAGVGVNAPVYMLETTGVKLAGGDYLAQLWAGDSAANLAAVGPTATFATGAQAGYFTAATGGGVRTIDGIAGGSDAVVQVRVWNAAAGATWAAASVNPIGFIGTSGTFTVKLAVPPATPPNLVGLTSFAIVPVPEPSTLALAGLGAAAMLIFRRRK